MKAFIPQIFPGADTWFPHVSQMVLLYQTCTLVLNHDGKLNRTVKMGIFPMLKEMVTRMDGRAKKFIYAHTTTRELWNLTMEASGIKIQS